MFASNVCFTLVFLCWLILHHPFHFLLKFFLLTDYDITSVYKEIVQFYTVFSLIRSSKGDKTVVRSSRSSCNWTLSLTHVSPMFLFYTPGKLQKIFSGDTADAKSMKFPCKLNFKKNAKMIEIRKNIVCK